MKDSKLNPIRVLIIDDSAFSRQTIKEILEKVPQVEIAGLAYDGQDGMAKILKLKPDIVTLDIEMPGMDGFTLLRWIMKEKPLPVIVVSAHFDDPTVFKALELGAVDFVKKPTNRASKELREIENDLVSKVLVVFSLRMEKLKKALSLLELKESKNNYLFEDNSFEIIAIGASTGGPTAIQTILTRLPEKFPCAIVISQHMPRGFTRQFADRISNISQLHVKEAEHGEPVESGKVLISPGGHHMVFEKLRKKIYTILKDSSGKDKYVPSIDKMMKSVADIYKSKTMGILLTGMGNDGKEGMLEIKKKGGFTIAESEKSAIVFGMPKEIIQAGGVDKVLVLQDIPGELLKKLGKKP